MAIVFKTPLNTKNLTTNDSQNIDSPIGCNLEAGSVEYNENGEYTLEPESADGFSSVEITVDVPSNVNNQEKSVTISANGTSTITYDANYTGLSSVGITVDVEPDLEAKTVEYTTNNTYTIAPSSGKDGISSATVTVNVDTVTPYNEGKAAGIAEQKAKLESATFVSNGTYTKEDGYNSVTVAVPSDINNQNKTATPSTSAQEITADSGYSGLGKVTISAVTAAIDSDIVAGNIKKDVEILGVTGTYDPQPELQDKTVTPSTSQQVISADSGYDGLDEVTVSAVTSSIDANIAAGNIKKDVTILGVTGTYEGSGGTNVPDWSSIGWSSSDVTASGLVADLSTNYSNSTTHFLPGSLDVSVTQIKNNTNVHYSPAATVLQGIGASYNNLFSGCTNLERVGISKSDTSDSDASSMFSGCTNLKSVAIDMTGISNVRYMFNNCQELSLSNITFSNFGTTNTSYMFYGLKNGEFIHSIPIDTSNVTNMSHMFDSSNTRFASTPMNTANVTDMSYMFANRGAASTLYSLPTMNTSNVTNMSGMFYNSDCGVGMKAILDL